MNHYPLQKKGNKFDFLSEDEMTNLVKEYYEGRTSMAELKNKYKLPIINKFEDHFPLIQTNQVCDLCKNKMVKVPHHRSWSANDPVCSVCGHNNEKYCPCWTCHEIEQKRELVAEELKNDRISAQLKKELLFPVSYEKLSAQEKITLGMLVRKMSSEDLTHIVPFVSKENWKNNKDFILPLFKSKILTIHPESNYNFIQAAENKFNETELTYEFYKMKWYVNVIKEGFSNIELYHHFATAGDKLNFTEEDVFRYWKLIARDETLKYLSYNFDFILKIPFESNFAIESLLDYLTNHFSIGQIYNLIWKYTNNTLRFMKERKTTTEHASNYLLKCIKNEAEKIIQNDYELAHYNKPKYLPANSFSDFFFNHILKSTGEGFRVLPSEIFSAKTVSFEDSNEFKTVGDLMKSYKFVK